MNPALSTAGLAEGVAVSWTNTAALSELQLRVFGSGGALLDSRPIDRLGTGPQSIAWDGRVGGTALPAGTYHLQLTGRTGGVAVAAPAAVPVSVDIAAAYGVTVDPRAGSTYVALPPTRLLDTRVGNGLAGAFGANVPRAFVVGGRGGIPANAVAVTGNLTVTGATRGGYVSLTPTSQVNPPTSTINFPAGDTRANGVTVTLAPDGTLAAVYKAPSGATVQLIFDVTGYYVATSAGSTYVALPPTRLLDTRVGNGLAGAFGANVPRAFVVGGRGGIPANAVAVTGNLTVTGATRGGYVSLTPTSQVNPPTSTINFPAGDTRANGVTVTLAPDGTLAAVYKAPSGATVQLIFDVTGYYR